MGFVNIIVHDETRDELSKLKSSPRDSYNDVIVKLIEEHERSRKE
jgi:predicted CopG family antitoxin